jgi:hypothetical protein
MHHDGTIAYALQGATVPGAGCGKATDLPAKLLCDPPYLAGGMMNGIAALYGALH